MRQYFEFRIILTVLFLLTLLVGCGCTGNFSKSKIGFAVLVDITEGCESRTLVTEPGIKDALGIHNPASYDPSVIAFMTDITGVDLRPVKTFRLNSKTEFGNPSVRAETVTSFVAGILDAVSDTVDGCNPTAASSIYKPLKSMVERLKEDTTLSRRVIILVSDGIENSNVSFLKNRGMEAQYKSKVARLEKTHGAFPELSSFEFILVHQPKENDGIGTKGVEFWQKFLETKGAKVRLSASL
jgi:hypothetical protein